MTNQNRFASPELLDKIIEDLIHVDFLRASEAKSTLIEMGDEAVDFLANALPFKSERHRWIIIQVLIIIGSNRALPAVAACLHYENRAVQAIAAQYLGSTGDARAVPYLIDYLVVNPDTSSTIWVLQALGRLGSAQAVNPILTTIRETKSSVIRYTGIEALGMIDDGECIDQIKKYLHDENHHVRTRTRTAIERLAQNRAQQGA